MDKQQQKNEMFFLSFWLIVLALLLTPAMAHNSQSEETAQVKQIKSKVEAAAIDKTTAVNATTSVDTTKASDIPLSKAPVASADPFERFNRGMFVFNDKLDVYILKPLATFYNAIVPRPLNQGIHNFFNNIGEIPTIANDILQLNFYQTNNDFWRLAINSTIGIGGLFDVASRLGLPYYANDFGLTLAAWGWRQSTYIVLPFFGPNTMRDVIEIPVDYYAFSLYPYIDPPSRRYQLYALGVLDRRVQLLQFQSVFEEAAVDKYVFTRNAYLQRRAYQIEKNKCLGYKGQVCEPKKAEN